MGWSGQQGMSLSAMAMPVQNVGPAPSVVEQDIFPAPHHSLVHVAGRALFKAHKRLHPDHDPNVVLSPALLKKSRV